MLRQHDLHDLIQRLEGDGEYRVLRKLKLCEGHTAVQYDGSDTFIGSVVDVETTGLDPDTDAIIELAVRRFRFDGQGQILSIDRVWSWLEDPGRPLSAKITQLTGLTDAGLVGQQIEDDSAMRLLKSCHLIIAHNAAFDLKFVERRLPDVAGLPWACSCHEIDWEGAGFEGAKKLGRLVRAPSERERTFITRRLRTRLGTSDPFSLIIALHQRERIKRKTIDGCNTASSPPSRGLQFHSFWPSAQRESFMERMV